MSEINYKEMESKALREYVLEHREDEEAIQELMSRRKPRSEAVVYPMWTEENMEWLTEVVRQKAEADRAKG